MKVELAGPGDLGHWYLVDRDGNAYPFVERHEDHPKAAALFGWKPPKGVMDEEEIIDNAIDFLMENIGEEIEAPKEVVEYFRELEEDGEDE
jgi:hypothetical protein